MLFNKPGSLVSVNAKKDSPIIYQYALKYPGRQFEVRYIVVPLDSQVAQYKASQNDTSITAIDPNLFFNKVFTVFTLNASGSIFSYGPQVKYFNLEGTKNEFNADEMGTVMVSPSSEFGEDYLYCLIVGIHKNNVADAYYFFLFNDLRAFPALMKLPFHALKFKAG